LDVEILSADVRDLESLEHAMPGVDVVYHLAGSISLEMDTAAQMMAINALGTRNVVASCLKFRVRRLVHFSSIDALRQDPFEEPVDENQALVDEGRSEAELANIPPYDVSKAQAEREVLAGIQHGLDAVIVRPTAMLGPYDFKPSYQGQALIKLARGKIPALVKGGFDWVDVRDVVAGARRAEQLAKPGTCYMLSGNWHTIRQVANMVASYTNQPAPAVTIPMGLADAFAPLMLMLARFNGSHPIYTRVTLSVLRSNTHISSAKAQRELGYAARPLTETVRDTIGWFQDNGYLPGKHP
jgi:dihydroflavonol-4-reductase